MKLYYFLCNIYIIAKKEESRHIFLETISSLACLLTSLKIEKEKEFQLSFMKHVLFLTEFISQEKLDSDNKCLVSFNSFLYNFTSYIHYIPSKCNTYLQKPCLDLKSQLLQIDKS